MPPKRKHKIEICNLRCEKPQHPRDVKVCRGVSVLGNIFELKDVNDDVARDKVCDKYVVWLDDKLNKECDQAVISELKRLKRLYKKHGKLRLFCWCAPKRCHAETIRKYILEE